MNEKNIYKIRLFQLSVQLNYIIKNTLVLFLILFRLKYKKQPPTTQKIIF